jgi:hypothetical protein
MTATIIPIAPPLGAYWPLQLSIEPTQEQIDITLAHIAGKHPTGKVYVTRLMVGGWLVYFELQDAEARERLEK